MTEIVKPDEDKFDKTNAFWAGVVFLLSFVVYALTVQRSLSFWDCGEFIACASILGIPHPPGTPLFVLMGRVAAMIPFVEDISYRINYLSVVSSALTAMFSYLLTVRLIGYLFNDEKSTPLNRYIAYVGGIAGGLFVAFSTTNWANSVEAEVYGFALALSVAIVWLTLRYFEERGTLAAAKTMIMVFYLALLGVGIHMTVFLVVPVCAIFFVLKKEATPRDWLYLCGFMISELLLIFFFSNTRVGAQGFYLVSFVLVGVLLALIYKRINWAILIAIGSTASVMISFSLYFMITPIAFGIIVLLAIMAKKYKWKLQWKTAMGIIFIAFIGLSTHLYIPIRSTMDPRIDENNPSRSWQTFVDFLDRKQYGQVSMTDRMFNRRGSWSNQFGRHPHMGFWSYFEEQYSRGGTSFLPFLALGLLGLIVAIRKRLEIGLPFLALLLVCSAGLIFYMNFADGTKYNFSSGDAYLEVRNRDYFFTPAFVFFGIAMGLGVGAIMQFMKERFGGTSFNSQRTVVYASCVLVLLPAITLAKNFHACDRSNNYIPYNYAVNLLNTCEPNAILFTSGDNDTFPVWCVQEVYNYRKDVRVVNLSLLNTDWYVHQMKHRYDVPISLTDEQILWHPTELSGGRVGKRPLEMFNDRPRKRKVYMEANGYRGELVRVQDMIMDEIVIESLVKTDSGIALKQPIYFSSPPYAASPLGLKDKIVLVGSVYRLVMGEIENRIDLDASYDLFMNKYIFTGYEDSKVYRDENATGVTVSYGVNSTRLFDALMKAGDTTRALNLARHMVDSYPEYWQSYMLLSDDALRRGDSTSSLTLMNQLQDSLTNFVASNPENLFYLQDLGLAKVYKGRAVNDQALIDEGIEHIWEAFNSNQNSSYAFRKLVTLLSQNGRATEIRDAALKFGEYGINRNDDFLRSILGYGDASSYPAGN